MHRPGVKTKNDAGEPPPATKKKSKGKRQAVCMPRCCLIAPGVGRRVCHDDLRMHVQRDDIVDLAQPPKLIGLELELRPEPAHLFEPVLHRKLTGLLRHAGQHRPARNVLLNRGRRPPWPFALAVSFWFLVNWEGERERDVVMVMVMAVCARARVYGGEADTRVSGTAGGGVKIICRCRQRPPTPARPLNPPRARARRSKMNYWIKL